MSRHARIATALLARPVDAEQRLARAYARAHGHVVSESWSTYARRMVRKILNWITNQTTAFKDFAALVNARADYLPSLRLDLDWRMLVLANAYDSHQTRVGDPRRAARYL